MKKRALISVTMVILAVCVCSSMTFAYPNSWTGPTGLFDIVAADCLEGRDFAGTFYFNNFDRESSSGTSVDLTYLSLPLAYGITNWFEISLAPHYNSYRVEDSDSENGMGDINLNLKFSLLPETKGVGLGLLLFGKIPTADEDKGLGTGETDYGVKALLSKHLTSVGMHLNVGYTKIGDPDGIDYDDQVTYGIGFNMPLEKQFQFIVELTGETAMSEYMEDPLDLTVGTRYFFESGLAIGAGLRYNLAMDADNCPVGGVFHLGYAKPVIVATPVPNKPPVITCKAESEEVNKGQYTRITAEAYDPDGDPITYKWTTTGCKLVGSGKEVQLHTDECKAGTYTVTVTVSDDKGLSATCSVNVTVIEKKVLEKVKLDLPPVLFKQGARVDNVAKAVLDDIAIKIKRYPDVQVTLVGHSDSQGSDESNYKMGLKRAENVKKYLVERHKINADRFIVESKGEKEPVADNKTEAGRRQNRRVEVIMMVEQEVN